MDQALGPSCRIITNRIITKELLLSHQPPIRPVINYLPIACLGDGSVVTRTRRGR